VTVVGSREKGVARGQSGGGHGQGVVWRQGEVVNGSLVHLRRSIQGRSGSLRSAVYGRRARRSADPRVVELRLRNLRAVAERIRIGDAAQLGWMSRINGHGEQRGGEVVDSDEWAE
jgi:hypothetical protein